MASYAKLSVTLPLIVKTISLRNQTINTNTNNENNNIISVHPDSIDCIQPNPNIKLDLNSNIKTTKVSIEIDPPTTLNSKVDEEYSVPTVILIFLQT